MSGYGSSASDGVFRDYDDGHDYYRESDDSSSSDDDSIAVGDVDISKLHLCSEHKSGSMTRDCDTCSAALAILPYPALINKLLSATDAGNLSRYGGRCDEVEATMKLSPMTVELARETFNGGKFRDKAIWADIIKKYLTLDAADHVKLTEDISAEDVFNKFRREKKFKFVFKFLSEMKDAIKDLRLAQRILFSIIEDLSDDLSSLRKLGEDVGVVYPETAPPREGNNVPRRGRKVPNHLETETFAGVFPRPDLSQFLAHTGLSHADSEDLANMFSKYRETVIQNFMELFTSYATALTKYDDKLIFYRVRNNYAFIVLIINYVH